MPVIDSIRQFFRNKVLRPLLLQLRGGANSRRVAWGLALGMLVGISPTFGITTVLAILLSWIFRVNQIASQVGTHTMSPLQIVLFVPFIQLGVKLFRTRPLPVDREQLIRLSRHPVHMFREIWQWEWHALVVWAVLAVVLTPLLARYFRRGLVLLLRRHRELARPESELQPAGR